MTTPIETDYIVVGLGLAGIAFCEQLLASGKSFVVFDTGAQQASGVAGGLYNPVVLRKFTPVWNIDQQLPLAMATYARLEQRLGVTLRHQLPIYRKFASVGEQNNWFTASDHPSLCNYLDKTIIQNTNPAIVAPLGFGKVNHTGRIDLKSLTQRYAAFLKTQKKLIETPFVHEALEIFDTSVNYKTIRSKKIVFAEGAAVRKNPFFENLPLSPTKGELLTIHAPLLKLDYILKGSVFVIPLEQDFYLVGATYDRQDTSSGITATAKNNLLNKLKTLIQTPFTVTAQVAGIRPTVKDRKPLVGQHPRHRPLYVLNGLGTRGVLIAPYVAMQLFDSIEAQKPLPSAIDCNRF